METVAIDYTSSDYKKREREREGGRDISVWRKTEKFNLLIRFYKSWLFRERERENDRERENKRDGNDIYR